MRNGLMEDGLMEVSESAGRCKDIWRGSERLCLKQKESRKRIQNQEACS